MNVRNIIMAAMFLLPSMMEAQHELKAQLFQFGIKSPRANIHYEYIIKKIGIEIDLVANGTDTAVQDSFPSIFNPANLPPPYTYFDQFNLSTNLTGKYYFRKNKGKFKGAFIGPTIGLTYLQKVDPAAIEKYKEQNQTDLTPNYLTKGINTYRLGFTFGYKFLIKSNFIIETGMRAIDNEPRNNDFGHPYKFNITDLRLMLKVGYRFNKKKKSAPENKDGL